MRDYGKVFSRIWESQDFRALSEDGRSLVLYLLTCQHGTIAGAFRVPDGYACEDLQWSSERVAKGFANLSEKGFATRCDATKWVWVTKFLEWNPPENPNQVKAALKIVASIPDQCAWKRAFMRVCGPTLGVDPSPYLEPLDNPLPTVPQPVSGTVAVAGTVAVPPSGGAAPNPSDPPAPPAPPKAKAADAAPTRGTRLPKDWTLTKPWGDWALKTYPLWTAEKVRLEAEKFRNHWTAKGTKDAAKLDWYATWQNWCHSHLAHQDDPKPPRQTGTEDDRRAANARATAEAAGLLGFAPIPPEEISHA